MQNSRSFRSLALPRRNSSIGVGSVQVSHSASVIGGRVRKCGGSPRVLIEASVGVRPQGRLQLLASGLRQPAAVDVEPV